MLNAQYTTPTRFLGPGRPPRRLRIPRQTSGRAFTLLELLIVVVVIALLVSILAPSLSQARALANQTKCLSNLRGIGLATRLYVNEHRQYPPAWQGSECRWMDLLKPFMSKKSGIYRCPSDREQIAVTWDPEIVLSYGINTFRFADRQHCFWYGVRASNVYRPTGTIIFADCTPGKYYCGGGGAFSEPVVDVDYRHLHGGFCAVFCDGHVETLTSTGQEYWDASR